MSVITKVIECSFYCHQNNGEKMGPSPILSVIHRVIVDTMLTLTVVITETG